MKVFISLFFFFLSFIPQLLMGQEHWIYYVNANYIKCQAFDGDYIWIGTTEGVVKFNKNTGDYKLYSTRDGLSNNDVRGIAIDGNGNKWIGTYGGGVNKFDGTNWTQYTTEKGLSNDKVMAVIIDAEGNKWFGTYGGGISKFDGTKWTTYKEAGGYVEALDVDSSGNVWSGSSDGLGKFDGQKWTVYKVVKGEQRVENYIHSIALETDTIVWCGTHAGVSRFDGQKWTTFSKSDGLPDSVILTIMSDKDKNIWCGTKWGLSKFDGGNWTTYTTKDGLVGNYTKNIAIDFDETLWIGTFNGLSKYNKSQWTSYFLGPSYNEVKEIACDKKGIIWIGTSFGLSRFDGKGWINYYEHDGLVFDAINALAVDKENNKWIGTSLGVSKFDGKNFTNYTTSDGLVNNIVTTVAIDSAGNKWFGTLRNGISIFDGKTWTTYNTQSGLRDDRVHSIGVDPKGNMWISLPYYFTKIEKDSMKIYKPEDGAPVISNAIAFDRDGNVWTEANKSGASKFDGKQWKIYRKEDGFVGTFVVWKIKCDYDGNMWFATEGGVGKFDGKTWTNYTTDNGLPQNRVTGMDIDLNGNKWFGTGERGVCVLQDQATNVTDIKEENQNKIINDFHISQNYPNPFNPLTIIRFQIPRLEDVKIRVYNILGQEVKILISKKLTTGSYEVQWDGTDNLGNKVASGIYIYRMETGTGYVNARKMVLIK